MHNEQAGSVSDDETENNGFSLDPRTLDHTAATAMALVAGAGTLAGTTQAPPACALGSTHNVIVAENLILVLVGGAITPAPAVPASTRILNFARLKRVQEHSSLVNAVTCSDIH